MSTESEDLPVVTLPERIRIGSFFLETLTTGMYEDAFHCVREYVQNGFDALTDAVAAGLIRAGDGRISVSIVGSTKSPGLTIRDNGVGIPLADAVDRLISLGASMKHPAHHAGFRGIGRLAGIAYCSALRFTTKAANEDAASVVEFDCGKLRGFMAPGAEPRDVSDVVRSSVSTRQMIARKSDHFTEVELLGLSGQGLEFVEPDKISAYLSEHSPVEYSEHFDLADRVRALASGFGKPIPIVEVELRNRRDRIPIRKPYANSFPTSQLNSKSSLHDLESFNSKDHGWFGWFGISNFPGEITDETSAGVRFRMKNIQIGDEGIIEDIASRLTTVGSERRLQRWAVGEIFVVNSEVVPNARRDGFEDNQAWRDIQADVQEVTKQIVKRVRGASKSRTKLKKVEGKIESNRAKLVEVTITKSTAGQVDLDLRRQLKDLEKAAEAGADRKEISQLISQIKELRESLQEKRFADEPPIALRPLEIEEPPELISLRIVSSILTEELGAEKAENLIALIRKRTVR